MAQVLYQVPEGSYATDPLGGVRVKEFRELVAALHKRLHCVSVGVVSRKGLGRGARRGLQPYLGLWLQQPEPLGPRSCLKSVRGVLDKCVPGYYHRRAEDGSYEHSTCISALLRARSEAEAV